MGYAQNLVDLLDDKAHAQTTIHHITQLETDVGNHTADLTTIETFLGSYLDASMPQWSLAHRQISLALLAQAMGAVKMEKYERFTADVGDAGQQVMGAVRDVGQQVMGTVRDVGQEAIGAVRDATAHQ